MKRLSARRRDNQKFVRWAIRFVLSALTVFCGRTVLAQDEPPCKPVICVTQNEFDVGWRAGTRVFRITNCECDQTLDFTTGSACDWVTITPPLGTLAPKESAVITVTFDYNDSCDARRCEVAVTAPGAIGSPATLSINQSGNDVPDVCVAPTERDVAAGAGVAHFQLWNWSCVQANWTATYSCPWILRVDPPSGTLEKDQRQIIDVYFRDNPRCNARTCQIDFGLGEAYALINQAGALVGKLDVSTASIDVASTSGTAPFSLTNSGCIPITWSAKYSCAWLNVVPASGTLAGGESVNVSATYNANTSCSSRECVVSFSSPEVDAAPQTVTVLQANGGSARLAVSPETLSVAGEAGWTSFVVSNSACSVMAWSVSESCAWVSSLVPNQGQLAAKESTTVTVIYAENPNPTARTCTVRVDAPEGGGPKNMVLTQQPRGSAKLLVQPSGRDVGSVAGSFTFTVSNTGSAGLAWSAQASCSWITSISPRSGSLLAGQSTTVTVNHAAYEGSEARTCEISVEAPSVAGSPQVIAVSQSGSAGTPALGVAPNTRLVGAGQGTASYTVTNAGSGTMEWSAAAACTWVSAVSPSGGSLGNGQSVTVNVTYEANTGPNARSCALQVTAPGVAGSPKSVAITQAGNDTPAIEVNPATLNTDEKAGLATFNVVNSGGGTLVWNATTSAAWISSLSPSSGALASGQGIAVVVNYQANNNGPSRTGLISVNAPGAPESPVTVSITQSGDETPVLAVAPVALQATQEAGTRNFTVTNSGLGSMDWSVSAEGDWITEIAPQAGSLAASESATVTVTYLANAAEAERASTLTVSAPGALNAPTAITLTQSGTAEQEPVCGCPFESFKGDWQTFFKKYLGDLLLLSVSMMLVLGLNRYRRD